MKPSNAIKPGSTPPPAATPSRASLAAFVESLAHDLPLPPDAPMPAFDHACWRCASHASYDRAKAWAASEGEFVGEAMVRGRPIALFRLSVPLIVASRRPTGVPWCVELLEIVAPPTSRSSAPPQDGWEHVELVTSQSEQDPNSNASWHGPFAHGPQENPEAHVRLSTGLVKVHRVPLLEIVEAERAARPRVACFDLDGTLVETQEALLESVAEVCASLGCSRPPRDAIERALAPTFPALFANLGLDILEHEATIAAALLEGTRCSIGATRARAKAIALLRKLREDERILIWTARDRPSALMILEAHGLLGCVDLLVTRDDGPEKPAIGAPLLAWEGAAITRVVGDSPVDAECARRLGVPFVDARVIPDATLSP